VTDGGPSRPDPAVYLIGGPAGAGKSRLAAALAGRIGSTVGQVDDLQTAIETLVPADRLPEYYVPATTYLRTDVPAEIVRATEEVATFLAPAVLSAIRNRRESGTPTVLEGDFISPEAAAEAAAWGVRSVFLLASHAEIRAHFLERDGDEQDGRAMVSALRSHELAVRCAELGLPAISARPFETLLERACAALGIAVAPI